jgi:hypothetical protein
MVLNHDVLDIGSGDAEQPRLVEPMVGPTNSARSGQHPRDSVPERCDSATRRCDDLAITERTCDPLLKRRGAVSSVAGRAVPTRYTASALGTTFLQGSGVCMERTWRRANQAVSGPAVVL